MKELKAFVWMTSVMLVACMVLASCKDNKKKMNTVWDDEEEDETELVEDEEADWENMADETETIDVRTAREFILALKSQTHIRVMTNDPLNLTEALDELIEEGYVDRYYQNNVPRTRPGIYWEPEYDGSNLYVVNIHDVLIEATHEDKGFLIVTPSYADVLRFEGCENITIKNLIMGHKVTGDCSGDVLVLNRCKNINIDGCELFGCGVNGLYAEGSSDIKVKNTELYGCSDHGIDMYRTSNVKFLRCRIYNNGSGMYIDPECNSISFDKCNFYDNRGQLFVCYNTITVKNSEIEHHHDDITDNVRLVNCTVHMDYDEAETLPDIDPDYEY